ncbi:hypothetical protein BSKO_04065 [Bryopsis sp. KO-2023]|nr:hypothetical protein BSKO_04065 [Bryopsis sp. KO-2023]
MAKRALLVGCNYAGTEYPLNGCINDVFSIKAVLTELYGFEEDSFTVLIDTDETYEQPTGKNIKARLGELVAASQAGDILFFHFSGHGTQIPGDNPDEADRSDEAICPTDFNVILDDDLRAIVKDLDDAVFFTFIADCCHSGGMLDHAGIQITGPKSDSVAPPVDVGAFLSAVGLKPKQVRGKKMEDLSGVNITNRSLPTEALMGLLGNKLGKPVGQGDLRPALGSLFGADASQKVQQYLQVAGMLVSMVEGTETAKTGCLATLLPMIKQLLGKIGGGGGGGGGAAGQPQHPPSAPPSVLPPGVKPPSEELLAQDKGVLITGCQASETSADACIGNDVSKSFGALTNAVTTIVRSHHAKNPGQPLPYSTLVYSVRDMLDKSGFSQNPCLEGSAKNADSNFVLGSAFSE